MKKKLETDMDLSSIGMLSAEDLGGTGTPALGGDSGRGELPNIPGDIPVTQDYKQMMNPVEAQGMSPVQQQLLPEEIDQYSSHVLGLPRSAPPINQLTLLANHAMDTAHPAAGEKGRQIGAHLVRRQMQGSKDTSWQSEPQLANYFKTLGLNAGRPDGWDAELKRIYGV